VNALLTAEQAAELLAVPPSWLLAQARAGKIPHVRLGRYVRFSADELAAWVEEQHRTAA
jgi:excisionase family DNA binding protein